MLDFPGGTVQGPHKEIESGLCLNLPFHESVYRRISVVLFLRMDFYVVSNKTMYIYSSKFLCRLFLFISYTRMCVCLRVCIFKKDF